jgi:hypothetical protein
MMRATLNLKFGSRDCGVASNLSFAAGIQNSFEHWAGVSGISILSDTLFVGFLLRA